MSFLEMLDVVNQALITRGAEPIASAMLFTAAKVAHLGLLPQGQPERYRRVWRMVQRHDEAGFGGCTNIGECAAVCPAGISMDFIARMNRDLVAATLRGDTS